MLGDGASQLDVDCGGNIMIYANLVIYYDVSNKILLGREQMIGNCKVCEP